MFLKVFVLMMSCLTVVKEISCSRNSQVCQSFENGLVDNSAELGQLELLSGKSYPRKSRSSGRVGGRSRIRPSKKIFKNLEKTHSLCPDEPDIFPRLPGTYGKNILKKRFGGLINKQGEPSRTYFGKYDSVEKPPSLRSIRNRNQRSRMDSERARRPFQKTNNDESKRSNYGRWERSNQRPYDRRSINERSGTLGKSETLNQRPYESRSTNERFRRSDNFGKFERSDQRPYDRKSTNEKPRRPYDPKYYGRRTYSKSEPFYQKSNGEKRVRFEETAKLENIADSPKKSYSRTNAQRSENQPAGTRTGTRTGYESKSEHSEKDFNKNRRNAKKSKKVYGKKQTSRKNSRPRPKSIKKMQGEEPLEKMNIPISLRAVTEAAAPKKFSSVFDNIPQMEAELRKQQAQKQQRTINRKNIRLQNKIRREAQKKNSDTVPILHDSAVNKIAVPETNKAKVEVKTPQVNPTFRKQNIAPPQMGNTDYSNMQNGMDNMVNRIPMSQGQIPMNNGPWMPPPMMPRSAQGMPPNSPMNMQQGRSGTYDYAPFKAKNNHLADGDSSSEYEYETDSDDEDSTELESKQAPVIEENELMKMEPEAFAALENDVTLMPSMKNTTEIFTNSTNTTETDSTTMMLETTTFNFIEV